MTFTLIEKEVKTSAKGTKYAIVSLKNEHGNEFKRVTLFSPDSTKNVGETIIGELAENVYNGKTNGWKFKAETTSTIFNKRATDFTKAIEQKQEGIAKSQDRKEDSIKLASAQRDAVLLVTTFYKDSFKLHTDEEMETVVKNKINEWRQWLLNNHDSGLPF